MIAPGKSSIMILRQLRGGGLDQHEKYKGKCDFRFEVDETQVRVHQTQRDDGQGHHIYTKKDGSEVVIFRD